MQPVLISYNKDYSDRIEIRQADLAHCCNDT